MTHVLLACTLGHCRRNAYEVWGWQETRFNGRDAAIDPDGNTVRFISNASEIPSLLPEVKVYLGYHWQYAYGGNVHELLDAHRTHGGQVIDNLPQWKAP